MRRLVYTSFRQSFSVATRFQTSEILAHCKAQQSVLPMKERSNHASGTRIVDACHCAGVKTDYHGSPQSKMPSRNVGQTFLPLNKKPFRKNGSALWLRAKSLSGKRPVARYRLANIRHLSKTLSNSILRNTLKNTHASWMVAIAQA